MPNDNGASKAPQATAVSLNSDKTRIEGDVAENLKWNIIADGTNYTIHPNGITETWLYSTNSNNGIRVGDGENKLFNWSEGYLINTALGRYVGVYNNQDWRSYTSIHANIANTVTSFYVYTEGDEGGEEPGEGGGEEPGDDPVVPEIPTEGDTYQLVTSDSELEANEKYIIVAADSNYAMSTTQNNNNRGQNGITKNGNLITLSDEDIDNVQVLTLEEGAIANTWAFYAPNYKDTSGNVQNGYLYAASSSSNHLKTFTTKNENGSASITISAEGIATIKFQGSNTRNWLQYNQSSSLFACYAEDKPQKDVSLYKYIDIETGVEDTMVDENAPVEYYNLQGVKVANPENGIFIKKQGAKATKVVL